MRPTWQHKLRLADVFHNDELTFEQRRDTIVARIRKAPWYNEDGDLFYLIDELADTEDVEDFDDVWASFYDYADRERIWVETR